MSLRKRKLNEIQEGEVERAREREEARRRLARVEASLRVLVPTAHLKKVRGHG